MRALTLAAIALLIGPGAALALSLSRTALWDVEQSCIANHRWVGAAFPCLEVNVSDGIQRGYAILQVPYGQRDTILVPTERVSGIEDPFLTSANAPNYMALAWQARRYIADKLRRPATQDDLGLAINSRYTRSQDQFHIHIGCVAKRTKARLADIAAGIPRGAWTRLSAPIRGQTYWGYEIAGQDLGAVNVLHLVAQVRPLITRDPATLTVAVVGMTRDHRDGFLVLAGETDSARGARQSTAEHLLDHSCRG